MSFQVLRPAVGANAPRWDGESRGHYEVWYLTMSDPASRRGFWFRYTFEVPRDPARGPIAELWGFAFTPGRPAVGGKRTLPPEWPPKGTMHVGEALLESGRATGELAEQGLSWDVSWEPADTAMWHIPAWLGRSSLPSTRVVSPTVSAEFSGTVRVGDETVDLSAAVGCQTHLWGRQHAARWAWGHCTGFTDGEGALRRDVILEVVHAVPLVGRGREAPIGMTLVYAEVDGEPIPCNALPWALTASSRLTGHRWELRGRTRSTRVRAVLEADPAEMAQVTYEDPDGAESWCANSEIARGALEIERRDGTFERFTTEDLAHVEFGAREPDPEVPILC